MAFRLIQTGDGVKCGKNKVQSLVSLFWIWSNIAQKNKASESKIKS
jgi:hypothetical protein